MWAKCQFLSFKPACASNEMFINSIQKNEEGDEDPEAAETQEFQISKTAISLMQLYGSIHKLHTFILKKRTFNRSNIVRKCAGRESLRNS